MKTQQRRMTIVERLRLALLVALGALAASMAVGCGTAQTSGEDAGYIERDIHPGVVDHVPADAEFMRDMIGHHGQALAMSALVEERSASDRMHLLARRIEETQEYEIGLMRDWLIDRGLAAPDPDDMLGPHGGHGDEHSGMAGMASAEQMRALADAEGEAFDRMFLELMIRHHEGALVMVEELKEHEGAGQEPEIFVLLSHVDADQRAEIARMRNMLNEL